MLRNNIAIPTVSGKGDLNTYTACGGGTSYTSSNNHVERVDGATVFEDPAAADFRPRAGSAIVVRVPPGDTFASWLSQGPGAGSARGPVRGHPRLESFSDLRDSDTSGRSCASATRKPPHVALRSRNCFHARSGRL